MQEASELKPSPEYQGHYQQIKALLGENQETSLKMDDETLDIKFEREEQWIPGYQGEVVEVNYTVYLRNAKYRAELSTHCSLSPNGLIQYGESVRSNFLRSLHITSHSFASDNIPSSIDDETRAEIKREREASRISLEKTVFATIGRFRERTVKL